MLPLLGLLILAGAAIQPTYAAGLTVDSLADSIADDGAYEAEVEVQSGPTFTVNTIDDHDDSFCTPDDCTLREAINAANLLAGADTIIFNISGTIPLSAPCPTSQTPPG